MSTYRERVKAAALKYAAMGIPVFPVYPNKKPFTNHGCKDATTDAGTIAKWYDNNNEEKLGVAIATGAPSGLVVIDVDEHEEYTDSDGKVHKAAHGEHILQEWCAKHGAFPDTVRARSCHGGTHYYFRTSEHYSSKQNILSSIDTRADGGYIVVPPSKDAFGNAYKWEKSFDEIEPAELGVSVDKLLRSGKEKKQDPTESREDSEVYEEGSRTSALIRIAGKLWNTGVSADTIKAAIIAENEAKCIPPLTEEELEREVFPALTRGWDRPEQLPRLPPFSKPRIMPGELPELKPELITGILRQGHKFQLSAPSKAGKSFLLIELAVALATGDYWLGLECKQGKVLYLNMEIDAASFENRLFRVCEAVHARTEQVAENVLIWHLRGYSRPLEELLAPLRQQIRATGAELEAVIIDPVYKLGLGDENSAEAVGNFCNQIDQLAESTQAAVIYAHHHSKGTQGKKASIDRASGSGVFARDPDAIMSMSPLVCTELDETEKTEQEQEAEDEITLMGRKAFRCTFTLREFPEHSPINCYFDYPLHSLTNNEVLVTLPEEGSKESNLMKSRKRNSKKNKFSDAFFYLLEHPDGDKKTPEGAVRIQDIADYLGVVSRTVTQWLMKDLSDQFERAGRGYCRLKNGN